MVHRVNRHCTVCNSPLKSCHATHFKDEVIIVLDEMNLSRPEQYFADLLSALARECDAQRWRR